MGGLNGHRHDHGEQRLTVGEVVALIDRETSRVLARVTREGALPMQLVRDELGFRVGLLNPHERFSIELSRVSTFKKKIREGVLRDSQFPDVVMEGEVRVVREDDGDLVLVAKPVRQ